MKEGGRSGAAHFRNCTDAMALNSLVLHLLSSRHEDLRAVDETVPSETHTFLTGDPLTAVMMSPREMEPSGRRATPCRGDPMTGAAAGLEGATSTTITPCPLMLMRCRMLCMIWSSATWIPRLGRCTCTGCTENARWLAL